MSVWRSLESDSFGVINYGSVMHGLSNDFSSRSLHGSVLGSLSGLERLGNRLVSDHSGLSSINIDHLFLGMDSRLHVSLSDGDLARDGHIHGFHSSSLIDNGFVGFSLRINGFSDHLSPNNWGLNNSLSNDRLRDQSLRNNGLGDDLSGDYRFGNQLLGLGDHWFGVQNLRGNSF